MLSVTLARTSFGLLQRPRSAMLVVDILSRPPTHSGTVVTAVRTFAAPKDVTARKKKSTKIPRKKKGKTEVAEGREKSQYQKDLDNIIAALDAPIRYEPTITAEEQERRRQIVRNYCIGRFEQHNAREHDLACKMKVKFHAVRMLPQRSKLKEAALDPDDEDEIPDNGFPMWTPPIPDFNPDDYEKYFAEEE